MGIKSIVIFGTLTQADFIGVSHPLSFLSVISENILFRVYLPHKHLEKLSSYESLRTDKTNRIKLKGEGKYVDLKKVCMQETN